MGTVLNVGINARIAEALGVYTKNPKFALDTQSRFLQSFGTSVLGVSKDAYTKIVNDVSSKKVRITINGQPNLDLEDLQEIVERFKNVAPVPDDIQEQLRLVVIAALQSWFSLLYVFCYFPSNH